MALLYCISHVCRALATLIDGFCVDFVLSRDHSSAVGEAVKSWNKLQATLRRATCALDNCFLVLFTCAVLAVFLPILVSPSFSVAVPGVLFSIGVASVSFACVSITSKCDRVPVIINSLSFGEDGISAERQYIVSYIVQSLAGFYILEVRFTPAMVLKTAYFSVAIIFALHTQILKRCSNT